MKNGPLFILGLFFALALSWAGLALGTHAQLGDLQPYYDDLEGKAFPQRAPGIASRGQLVYQDLGCMSCHTQQVRRPSYGADEARGWGSRQSVARDYVHQNRPLLGQNRLGPDLANFGKRAEAAGTTKIDLLVDLYNGSQGMPAYRFLFEEREIVGQTSGNALHGVAPDGYELVPTEHAETLVAYLLSLKQIYEYPEARPYAPDVNQEGAR